MPSGTSHQAESQRILEVPGLPFRHGWAACPSGGGRQEGRVGCYSGSPLVPDGSRARLGHTAKYRKCPGSVLDLSRPLALVRMATCRNPIEYNGFVLLLHVKCRYLSSCRRSRDSGSNFFATLIPLLCWIGTRRTFGPPPPPSSSFHFRFWRQNPVAAR